MKLTRTIYRYFRRAIGLREGTDVEGTIAGISSSVHLKGVNIWMLLCSAILASIGLNVNSSAVLIGAMLISPLMSPILGVGLATAILDRVLLRDSLRNLLLAAVLGLAASTLYFLLSPLAEITPEMAARTTPTILDVGVAFFGGVAGVVAGSRRDKTNAIPGVAIATALMPPLCTAGSGLAKWDLTIFLGAFYLFFINAVFIALATYLVAVYLRFPVKDVVEGETLVQVKRFIIGFVVLTIIPSALIFYNVLEKVRVDRGVKQFIERECRNDERQAVDWELERSSNPPVLKVYIIGKSIDAAEKKRLQDALDSYNIGNLRLKTIQLDIPPDEFERLNKEVATDLADQVRLLKALAEERQGVVDQLQARVAELEDNGDPVKRFLKDSRALFPEITSLKWEPTPNENKEKNGPANSIVVGFHSDTAQAERLRVKEKLAQQARLVLAEENVGIIEEQPEAPAAVESN